MRIKNYGTKDLVLGREGIRVAPGAIVDIPEGFLKQFAPEDVADLRPVEPPQPVKLKAKPKAQPTDDEKSANELVALLRNSAG